MAAAETTPWLGALHAGIAHYYGHTLRRHGATPRGVDWTCRPTQELRFVQLLRLCDFSAPLSLNDLGCGYGALLAFLVARRQARFVDYLGVDLSNEMIAAADALWRGRRQAQFMVGGAAPQVADYSVASGIFNVKQDVSSQRWAHFVARTLETLNEGSRRGFAVNFLAPLPRGASGNPGLYRAPAAVWRGHCERNFGASVEVVRGYGMREYTLLVRRG